MTAKLMPCDDLGSFLLPPAAWSEPALLGAGTGCILGLAHRGRDFLPLLAPKDCFDGKTYTFLASIATMPIISKPPLPVPFSTTGIGWLVYVKEAAPDTSPPAVMVDRVKFLERRLWLVSLHPGTPPLLARLRATVNKQRRIKTRIITRQAKVVDDSHTWSFLTLELDPMQRTADSTLRGDSTHRSFSSSNGAAHA